MAAAPAQPPVKSQPLHNFSLPFLKWGGTAKNHNTNATHHHRYRRPSLLPSDPDSDHDSRPHRLGSRPPRNRFGLPPTSLPHHPPPPPHDDTTTDDELKRCDTTTADDAEETVHKPWNLRPRKPTLPKTVLEIGAGTSRNSSHNHSGNSNNNGEFNEAGENHAPKSLRLRGFADTQCTEKKEKRKFWIALSREEIEEDIFVMTGSRPARRPRKRPKNVQKQMDTVFPGLWLVGITADAYRVADTPAKK